jgi:hypothetical protein
MNKSNNNPEPIHALMIGSVVLGFSVIAGLIILLIILIFPWNIEKFSEPNSNVSDSSISTSSFSTVENNPDSIITKNRDLTTVNECKCPNDALEIDYKPSIIANWNPATPSTVQNALDGLVSLQYTTASAAWTSFTVSTSSSIRYWKKGSLLYLSFVAFPIIPVINGNSDSIDSNAILPPGYRPALATSCFLNWRTAITNHLIQVIVNTNGTLSIKRFDDGKFPLEESLITKNTPIFIIWLT